MLDLQPIKTRLEMASPDKGRRVGYPPDADLQNNAYDDLTTLVDEVERLRGAIETACKAWGTKCSLDAIEIHELWGVLQ